MVEVDPNLNRRREPRRPVKLPVCISGIDAEGDLYEQNVVAVNISTCGALVTGVQHRIRFGDVVQITHRDSKARFRVVWMGEAGSQGRKVAIHKLEGDECPWNESMPGTRASSDATQTTINSPSRNRNEAVSCNSEPRGGDKAYRQTRRWRRYKVDVPIRVIIHAPSKTSFFLGRGNELSEGGMALTAGVELLPGDALDIEFTPPYSGLPIRHTGIVRNRAGYRYGIEFLTDTSKDAQQTERLLTMLMSM
jgi:hypothetical protein